MTISSFLAPLLLTIAVECLIAVIFGYRGRNFFIVLILANVITNPLLNYVVSVVSLLWTGGSRYIIIPLEAAAVYAEWKLLCYAFPEEQRSFLKLSVLMNAASYLTGLLAVVLFAK
jgi:hypothetical protein